MAYRLTTDKTWSQVKEDIREQLARWGVNTYSLEQPFAPPNTTKTRAWKESEKERTVRLTANWQNGRKLVLEYNKQERAVDNARVLFLAIESIRLNEVRGIGDVLAEAYLQLPAGTQEVIDPYEVLDVTRTAPLAVAEAAWKVAMQTAHPDKGGTNERAALLNKAIEMIREDKSR